MGTATGIISKAPRAVTAATTVSGNELVIADATTGAFTVTGPAAGAARRWGVKKSDTSVNSVTISYLNAAGSGATTILSVSDDAKTFEPLGSGYVATGADRSRVVDDLRYASNQAAPLITATPGIYSRARSIYNLKPTHLRNTRAAIGAAIAGTGLFKHAALGTSIAAGQTLADSTRAWPRVLRSLCASRGIPSAGDLSVLNLADSGFDTRWTTTGTVVGFGFSTWPRTDMVEAKSTGATATYTSTNAGTIMDVYYSHFGSSFTISIDGGSAVTITTNGSNAIGVYTTTGLANTTHSVVLTRTAASSTYWVGAAVRNPTGMMTYNLGSGGARVSDTWDSSLGLGYVTGTFAKNTLAPDLLTMNFMTNEANTSVTAATFKTNMAGLIAQQKATGTDIMLISEIDAGGLTLLPYRQALYELADQYDLPLVDVADRWGNYAAANSSGLMQDTFHPNPKGHAVYAQAILDAIMP